MLLSNLSKCRFRNFEAESSFCFGDSEFADQLGNLRSLFGKKRQAAAAVVLPRTILFYCRVEEIGWEESFWHD